MHSRARTESFEQPASQADLGVRRGWLGSCAQALWTTTRNELSIMPAKPSIILVGFKPENKIVPENLKDFLTKALESATRDVEGAGYELTIIDPVPYLEKGLQNLVDYFSQQRPEGVCVGFGVRAQPEHTFVFEQLIEAVRRGSPGAKIMFNTNPGSTLEAIQRWLPLEGKGT